MGALTRFNKVCERLDGRDLERRRQYATTWRTLFKDEKRCKTSVSGQLVVVRSTVHLRPSVNM